MPSTSPDRVTDAMIRARNQAELKMTVVTVSSGDSHEYISNCNVLTHMRACRGASAEQAVHFRVISVRCSTHVGIRFLKDGSWRSKWVHGI